MRCPRVRGRAHLTKLLSAQVVVTGGDLTNLRGKVTNVLADGRVEVMPTQLGLNEALTFDAGQIRKFFEVRAAALCISGMQALCMLPAFAGLHKAIHPMTKNAVCMRMSADIAPEQVVLGIRGVYLT
jgi:hypothetical protein